MRRSEYTSPAIEWPVTRRRVLLCALLAAGLGVTAARLHDTREISGPLKPLARYQDELDDFFDDGDAERDALEAAIARARRGVVRVRVTTERRDVNGVTVTHSSIGSGFVIATGTLLLVSAHQGRPTFSSAPHIARVDFATPDGRAFVASLIEFVDDSEDWALCRIRNPFERSLASLELGSAQSGALVAALGYPVVDGGTFQAGLARGRSEPIVAGGAHGRPWPAADAFAVIAQRVDGPSSFEAELRMTLPEIGGMSGGPVIDVSGRVVALTNGFRSKGLRLANTGEGVRMVGSVTFLATSANAFEASVETARNDRTLWRERIADRIASVAKDFFDNQATPTEFGLSATERAIAGLPPEGELEEGFTISHFQAQRWQEAQLRVVQARGSEALSELRRTLDAELGAPWSAELSGFARGSLFDACEATSTTIGIRAIQPLIESPWELVRGRGIAYLATIAYDVPSAYRVAIACATDDPDDEVRTQAAATARILVDALLTATKGWSLDRALSRAASPIDNARLEAAGALAWQRSDDARQRLHDMADGDPDPAVRAAAAALLARPHPERRYGRPAANDPQGREGTTPEK